MIVLDASVVVELLRNGPLAEAIRQELESAAEPLLVPHLLDIEVISALRRIASAAPKGRSTRDQFLQRLAALPAERYPHTPFLERIWELRHNFTSYDAAYIALAEASGAVLYTCDSKLARGHLARVRVFGG